MKKRSWNRAKKYRAKTKGLKIYLKFLKKQRHKKARKNKHPDLIYKQTGAWDII